MAIEYQPICASIVIDLSNNTIEWEENSVAATATVASGTYYLFGQGVTSSDLVTALEAALLASSPTATAYSIAVGFGVDVNMAASAVAMQDLVGSLPIELKGTSTFDLGLLGFAQADTGASDPLISDFSCSHSWVSNQPATIIDAGPYTRNMMEHVTPDGSAFYFAAGDTHEFRKLGFQYAERPRTFEESAVFQNTGFDLFWQTINDGRALRVFHKASVFLPAGPLVSVIGENVLIGVLLGDALGDYTLTGGALTKFDATRPVPGLPAYNWGLGLRKVLP